MVNAAPEQTERYNPTFISTACFVLLTGIDRPMKSAWFVVSLTAFISVQAATCQAEKPNVLYIVADDLGFSDLGCYGGDIDTPTLDALASNGVRMTQFYNTGRCCPSRAAILTGQYPHRVGLGHMTTNDLGQPGYRGVVSSEAKTIGQVLASANYRCFMSGTWEHRIPPSTASRSFMERWSVPSDFLIQTTSFASPQTAQRDGILTASSMRPMR